MLKTLRVREKDGWITKPPENIPENRLFAHEIDDNFLSLEENIESKVYFTEKNTSSVFEYVIDEFDKDEYDVVYYQIYLKRGSEAYSSKFTVININNTLQMGSEFDIQSSVSGLDVFGSFTVVEYNNKIRLLHTPNSNTLTTIKIRREGITY